MFLFPKVRDDGGVVVGAQGGQRLLDVELPGQDPEEIQRGPVLSVGLATPASDFALQGAAEGHQEELEEVQRPVQCQGQDASEQGRLSYIIIMIRV